jgi:hypothetical protein
MRGSAVVALFAAVAVVALGPGIAAGGVAAASPAGSANWGRAVGAPGATLGAGENAAVRSVSCSAAGDCTAAGDYGGDAFVVSQVRVSCSSAGNCSASGEYADRSGREQAFVVSQVRGTWGEAIKLPGTGALGSAG